MIFYLEDGTPFPPVNLANPDGLLCFGGELSTERLIEAYSSGIFPWADDPVLWFTPDPRMVIELEDWKPSKSLKRTFNKGLFTLTVDQHFKTVMTKCAVTRESTWISDIFLENYSKLHEMGIAHSFEVHYEGTLVGGLYGISLGSAFFGESMFHEKTDASKVAFMHLIKFLQFHKFTLLDCQINNSHLVRLGGIDISRPEYIKRLNCALESETRKTKWQGLAEDYLKSLA
ncbi:MAG: leucyl/phenylalanyl-tRNA--protein transferase [Lentisphaeraceae bacterium]|nr:leucyl/phenylalanyl-tRNA--protein transferase [Lentisphaeraceae bacterium]